MQAFLCHQEIFAGLREKEKIELKRYETRGFPHQGHFSVDIGYNGSIIWVFLEDCSRIRAYKEGCGECVAERRLWTEDGYACPLMSGIARGRIKNVAIADAVLFKISLIVTRGGHTRILDREDPDIPPLPGMLNSDPPFLALGVGAPAVKVSARVDKPAGDPRIAQGPRGHVHSPALGDSAPVQFHSRLKDKPVCFKTDFVHTHKRQCCLYLFRPGNAIFLRGKTPEVNQRPDRYVKKPSRLQKNPARLLEELNNEGRGKVLTARRKVLLNRSEYISDFFLNGADLPGRTENLDLAERIKRKKGKALPSFSDPT